MFPERPRRPITNRSLNQTQQPEYNHKSAKILALFQDDKGDLDIDKIMDTTHQLNKIYRDIRPLIDPFLKK